MSRKPNPAKIKVLTGRAMIYLNGKRGGVSLVSIEDLPKVRGYPWYLDANGYVQATVARKNVALHRLLLQPKPDEICDHKNGNKLDNRRTNLRATSRSMNNYNRNRGTETGVYFSRPMKSWVACLNFGGEKLHLSYHPTKEDAIAARLVAETAHVGENRPRFGARRIK